MADFCSQCSIETFGEDCGDLRMHEIAAKMEADGALLIPKDERMWPALCEGCGPTYVDDDGRCICEDCRLKHGLNP